jgi:predicted anti-sigma-YlaC factor YlaD
MADCQETLKELERFIDAEMAQFEAEEVVSHLKICTDCQGAFEFHAELRQAIRVKATRDELPAGFTERLMQCFGDDILRPD